MIIQHQVWYSYTKYLIANSYSSIQLNLYNAEQEFSDTAFIYALWVEPKYRRQSRAKKLLATAENIALKNGYKFALLEWEKKDSPKWVLEWYLRTGYKEIKSDELGCLLKKSLNLKNILI